MTIWNKLFGKRKTEETTNPDPEIFLEHLQSIFGEQDSIQMGGPATDGGPPICVFVFRDKPQGMITGVTYGLSLCPYPTWKFARPEMIVSVESNDIGWPCAAATFAAMFRGEKPFQYGDIFTTDIPLAPDTKMDGFLVFAQSVLDEEVQEVQLSTYKVHFSQFYPIYREEIPIYERIGLEAFWKHRDFDRYAANRKPIRE
jgi:suppressor of fused protein SUFU